MMSQLSKVKPQALLIAPPIYDFAAFDMHLKPYALLRLGRWLDEAGYKVELLNCLNYTERQSQTKLGRPKRYSDGTGKFFRQLVEKPQALKAIPRYFARYGILKEVIEDRIRAFTPNLVLVSSGMTYWYLGVDEVVQLVKKVYPTVPVVLGGVYATLCSKHAKARIEADYLVEGPALPALSQILNELKLPVPKAQLPISGLLVEEGYLGSAAIRLNTGCPLSCAYCASRLLSGESSPGRGEELFDWVKELNKEYGLKHFCFYDDALLVQPHTGIISFLEKVIESGLELYFHVPNGLHVALISKEIAGLMKRAGVVNFKLGFESAAEEFHLSYDTKYTREMFVEAIEKLKGAGFKSQEIAIYVLAGLPGQYPEEVESSIRFAASFGIKVYVAEYSPIPGTALWPACVAQSVFPIAEEPLYHNNSIFPLQWEKFRPKDMQRLKQLAQALTRLTPNHV